VNPVALTIASRRALKFLHTLGAAGFMGGMGALLVVVLVAPGSIGAMAKIAAWIIAPSMILTVVSGLLAMAANPAFYDAGWVWVKLASGILVLEGGVHLLGPIQEEAKRGAGDPAGLATLLRSESGTLWVLLAVSAANVALGIWRPRFMKDLD
jgi:uncharacterized membrane protein